MLEPPRILPVDLSVSSIRLFITCPERWRRRYIEGEYEPTGGAAIVGSAVGATEGAHFQQVADGQDGLSTEDALDLYSQEWDWAKNSQEVNWGGKPGKFKDDGAISLEYYHERLAPMVKPVNVERKFNLRFEGCDWTVRGYFDVEEENDIVSDLKVKGRKMSDADIDGDMQASLYLLAKRQEGEPAKEFRFHETIRGKPQARIVATTRTDKQLDTLAARILGIASEMDWRIQNDVWDYAAPGSWMCSERWCGFWKTCPGGGQTR